ncbi:MAG: acyltransferase family protein [Candidatus Dormibacteria bacterium]|jgi:peptidoglycan/LPS O-acetylase OafA/YrhL
MPPPARGEGRYIAGLDGLRAVAVLAVVLYHLNVGWTSGGLLGVGVFFVLSGYLITDLLLAERERDGAIALGRFWLRRARRLLPALWVMLVVVTLWIVFLDPSQLGGIRGALLAALLYFSNWWYAFQHVSYFASFGAPSPLGHLWSLAVEEQFYLVWPLLLILALRFVHRRWLLMGLVIAGALASAWAMAALFQPGSDPTRVYEGTDTRAFQLLIGASLAIVWPSRNLTGPLSVLRRRGLDALGGLGLAVIVVMVMDTNEYQAFLYRGGMVILSLATVAVIAALAHPAALLGRILGAPPLRWIGVRSYGIYLWHYPIIVLTTPVDSTPGPLLALLQVGATVAVAGLSWHFVEEPIRRRGFRGVFAALVAPRWSFRGIPTGLWAGLAGAGLVLGLSGVGLSGVISAAPASSVVATPASLVVVPSAIRAVNPRPPVPTAPPCAPPPASPSPTAGSPASPPAPSLLQATVIGDSIMIDVAPDLHQLLPNAYISGQVSRQMAALPAVIAQLSAAGELSPRLVIELGTNGPGWSPGQVAAVLRPLQLQRLVLVNAGNDPAHPDWPPIINQELDQVAAQVPNTVVVNWAAASAGQPQYFTWGAAPGDGIHPGPIGSEAMAVLIAEAVESGSAPSPSAAAMGPQVHLLGCAA